MPQKFYVDGDTLTQTVFPRPFVIRFELARDPRFVSRFIADLHALFQEELPGHGVIHPRPELCREPDGSWVELYRLHSDAAFWEAYLTRGISYSARVEGGLSDRAIALDTESSPAEFAKPA